LAAPPRGPVPPPIVPAVFVAADPISNDMKGIPEFDGREGWNGAVGTRRCWMFPPVATVGFPPDGKTTGGTANSLDMFVDFERKLGFLDQWIRDLVLVFLLRSLKFFLLLFVFVFGRNETYRVRKGEGFYIYIYIFLYSDDVSKPMSRRPS
jgi:hypothetical protein